MIGLIIVPFLATIALSFGISALMRGQTFAASFLCSVAVFMFYTALVSTTRKAIREHVAYTTQTFTIERPPVVENFDAGLDTEVRITDIERAALFGGRSISRGIQ